jgi:membrane protease YdiL (CAAX protease family)
VTAPAGPDRGSLVDALTLPGGVDRRAPDARRGGGAGLWLRRLGALVFWASIQGAFLLPALPPLDEMLPNVSPLAGALFNVLVAVGFVWWFVLRPRARGERRRLATFRIRPVAPAVARWVPLAAAGMIGVVLASLVILPRVMAVPKSDAAFLEAYLRRPFAPVALLIMVAVVAPLLEEFLFRGWMQRSLERRTLPWRAILITAVAFGVAHGDAFGLPLRVVFGVASGYAAYATRSIWPSVVLHGAYNGSLVLLSGALPKVDERTISVWAQNDRIFLTALAVLAACACVLALALRAMRDAASADRAARVTPTRPTALRPSLG